MKAPESTAVIAKYVFLSLVDAQPGISDFELLRLACESMYMDYFSYSQIAQEMVDKGLALRSKRKGESRKDATGQAVDRWDITERGKAVLSSLLPSLPDGVIRYVRGLGRDAHASSLLEARAQMEASGFGDYWAVLQLWEGSRLRYEMRLLFPTVEAGEASCLKWKKEAEQLYLHMLQPFFSEDQVDFVE